MSVSILESLAVAPDLASFEAMGYSTLRGLEIAPGEPAAGFMVSDFGFCSCLRPKQIPISSFEALAWIPTVPDPANKSA